MKNQRNTAQLLIAKDIARAATSGTVIKSYNDLSDGEIVVCSSSNVVLQIGGTYDDANEKRIKFIQRSGTTLLHSALIDADSLKKYSIETYAAQTEQVTYVGYNGTSGSLDVIDENMYTIRLRYTPSDTAGFASNIIKRGEYKSATTAIEYDIAHGLAFSLAASVKVEPERVTKVEMVSSATTVATASGAFAMVQGSKYCTVAESTAGAADAGRYNTSVVFVAGDFIRFGHATTKTYPVYRIISITNANTALATIELDRTYEGTSGSVAAASAGGMLSATGLAGDFGIKISGVASTRTAPKWEPFVNRFEIQALGFTSTSVTNSTAAAAGVGNYVQVAALEKQLNCNEADYYRDSFLAATLRSDALSSETYDMLCLEFTDVTEGQLGDTANSYKQLYIALATTASAAAKQIADPTSGIVTVLEDWAITSWLINGITTQVSKLT